MGKELTPRGGRLWLFFVFRMTKSPEQSETQRVNWSISISSEKLRQSLPVSLRPSFHGGIANAFTLPFAAISLCMRAPRSPVCLTVVCEMKHQENPETPSTQKQTTKTLWVKKVGITWDWGIARENVVEFRRTTRKRRSSTPCQTFHRPPPETGMASLA